MAHSVSSPMTHSVSRPVSHCRHQTPVSLVIVPLVTGREAAVRDGQRLQDSGHSQLTAVTGANEAIVATLIALLRLQFIMTIYLVQYRVTSL